MASQHSSVTALSKDPKSIHAPRPVYCHLCKVNFKDNEVFRLHIMQKHRPTSSLYEGESDTSSEEELQIKSQIEIKSGEDNYDPEMTNCTQSLFNISETAVSPQSSSSLKKTKGEKDLRNCSLNKCDQLEGNKASEQVTQSFPPLNLNAVDNSSFELNPVINPLPEVIFPNIPLQLVHSCITQPLISSQTVSQYQPEPITNKLDSTSNLAFNLNTESIIQWHDKWKRISKPFNDPLPKRYLKKLKVVHRTIFDSLFIDGHFLTGEEKRAVFNIFEEMNDILCRNAEYAGKYL